MAKTMPSVPWALVVMTGIAGTAAVAGAGDRCTPAIGPQVRVDTIGGTVSSNETTASASDANPMDVVAGWNAHPDSGGVLRSGFSVSHDGGRTWDGFILRPPEQNQAGTEGDPMTAFDPRTGTLWAGAIAFSGSGGLYVARKRPDEETLGPAVMATTDGNEDKGWMVAGPRINQPSTTRVFITYNRGIIWSDDMGDSWSSPQSLGPGLGFLPRIGPNGEIYVAYWDVSDGVMLKRSLNDGASFTTHRMATRMDVWSTQDSSRFPGTFRTPSLNYLDVDPDGTLHACYFDTTNIVEGNRNVDLYYTRSTDQGTTWSTPRVINGDEDPPGDQLFSWIECDGRGRIHLVYLDSRHTLQNDGVENGMYDAYYAVSCDGGDTFTEHRLTPDSWNCADDGIPGLQFLGDYLGLAVAGDTAWPIYIDTSNGRSELYTNVVDFACPADVNDDGEVDFDDLLLLLAAWGECADCDEDLDDDGDVDFDDLLRILSDWGPCP